MLIEGRIIVKQSIEKAWNLFLNPETLASCVPGVEKLELVDQNTYESVVKQKVGPISVRFKFLTTLVDIKAPNHFKAVGKGSDLGKAGNFSQETTVDLRETAEGEVEVSYRSEVKIVGKLATFGNRIMQAKAKQVEEQFTKALNEKLSQGTL